MLYNISHKMGKKLKSSDQRTFFSCFVNCWRPQKVISSTAVHVLDFTAIRSADYISISYVSAL